MFVNPISNFNFSNTKFSALRDNEGSEKPTPAEPAPQPEAPKLRAQLSRDTVSFGEKDKKANGMKALPIAIALASAAGGIGSCTPDYESNTSLSSSTVINLKDYHKCGCDSFPVVIPGGKDTVYIPVPGETVHDTIIVEKPGETVHDTIYVEKPGETVHDTIYVDNPPDTIVVDRPVYDTIYVDKPVYDTIYVDRPVYDTVYVDRPVHDTIWVKPDTVYIPKKPHFEMNDTINKDIEDFDIPTEGKGDFVYRFEGNNEYEQISHNLIFNGFFSSERKSSFIDYVVDYEDPENPKMSYYRIDYSASPANGSRVVQLYKPANGMEQLPKDKETGEAGWRFVGQFNVKKGLSEEKVLQLAIRNIDNNLTTRYFKNEKRGPGNMYKEWELDDGSKPITTVKNIKAHKIDLDDLE